MKIKALFLIALVSCFTLVSVAKADEGGVSSYNTTITPTQEAPSNVTFPLSVKGVQNINPSGVALFFPTYNSTTVTLTYVESINYTIQVSALDIHHYETSSPTGITFVAEGVATYALHYQVLYGIMVNQSITLMVLSGDGQTTIIPIACSNEGFSLDVTIVTSIQPHYPSPEDVWDYGASQQQQMLWNISQSYQAQQQQNTIILYSLGAGLGIAIAVLCLVIRHMRMKDRELYEWKMRTRGMTE